MSEIQTDETQPSDFVSALNSMLDNLENVVVTFQKTLLLMLEKIEKLESLKEASRGETVPDDEGLSTEEMEQLADDVTNLAEVPRSALAEGAEMKQKYSHLKIRFALGLVTVLIGFLASNLALFYWVEGIGLHGLLGGYARYVCAYGGFAAMVFGAALTSDCLGLRNLLKRKYVTDKEITACSEVDKEEEKKEIVGRGHKTRGKTIVAIPVAIALFMLCPMVVSSIVSYNATVIITPKWSEAFVYYRSNTGSSLLASCKERMWNGALWSSEHEMSSSGSAVQHVRAVYCPNKSRGYEKIVVTLSNDGYLDAYVWDGGSWLVTNDIGYVGTTVDVYRSYDIVYERASGRALFVYAISSSDTTKDLGYKIWDGTQWSSVDYLNDPSISDIQYYWVKLASYPLTTGRVNEIALIASEENSDDANAWIWDGGSWGNYLRLEDYVASRTRECISVEYEQQSGDAMFIWGYRSGGGPPPPPPGYVQSRKWTGSWGSELPQVSLGDARPYWFTLKADPASNRLMTVSVDSERDLNTIRWDGSFWTRDTQHDSNVDAYSARCADFEWEPSGSKGLLVWGTSSGSLSYKTFTAPSTWSGTSTITAAGTHPWVQLRRNTRDVGSEDRILGAMINSNYDLGALKWDGSTLTNSGDSTFTSDTTTIEFECFDIVFNNPN